VSHVDVSSPSARRIRLVAWAHLVIGLGVVVTVLALRMSPGVALLRVEGWPEERRWIVALNVIQLLWGLGLTGVGLGLLARRASARPWAISLGAVSVYHFFAHGGWVSALRWWRVVNEGSNLALAATTLTAVTTVVLGTFSLWFFTRRAVRQALPVSTRSTRWLIPVAAAVLVLAWEYSRTELQAANLAAFERARRLPPATHP
jgi:hypothetical protein